MNTEKEQTTMNTTIHPIHPTLQFEAKHALRFLDNLLQSSASIVDMNRDCFASVPVFANGRDLKEDFLTLTGNIGPCEFTWENDWLKWTHLGLRCRNDEAYFDDTPFDFLYGIWECQIPEAKACVRAAVSRLAKAVSSFEPSKVGGVAGRFRTLVRDYRLTALEANLLLAGLCVSHDLLEYGLSTRRCRNFLISVEEAAAYIGCSVDDIMPLVRNDSRLMASSLLDDDLTPSRDILMYLEGHTVGPEIRGHNMRPADDEDEDWDPLFDDFICSKEH